MSALERRRLAYAVSAEREIAWFRFASALLVAPAAVAVLVLARPIGAKVIAAVGLAASVGWVVAFFRARARIREAHERHLDIGPEGLRIVLGAEPVEVRWSEVESVDVDEERLLLVVKLAGGGALELPPVWEGVGLEELRVLIEDTRDGALRSPHR